MSTVTDTSVFYTTDTFSTIDAVRNKPTDTEPTGLFSGVPLSKLLDLYPTLAIGNLQAVIELKENALRHGPMEIDEVSFNEALGCMPPRNFTRSTNACTFACAENTYQSICDLYAYAHNRYWHLRDRWDLSHEQIVQLVDDALKA